MKSDFKTLEIEVEDGIAVVRMNNPPVNQLSEYFTDDIEQAFRSAFEDSEIKAIVLTGTGKNFIAGADLKEIYKLRDKADIYHKVKAAADSLNRIEMGAKPVVAAINGNALGGGLELAMACHYRLASKGARLGLPEVKMGLIPGTGGTQRLPRLIGLVNALDLITTGKAITAEQAERTGLIDGVTENDNLIQLARAIAKRFVSGEIALAGRRTRFKNTRLPSSLELKAVCEAATAATLVKSKGYPAPLKAIEAIGKGLSFDIESDMDRELDIFCDCALSDVAKNVIGTFLSTRSAGKLPRIEGIQPANIKKVAILGGGVMGSGIVHLLITSGFDTLLWEINHEALEKASINIKRTFNSSLKKKMLTEADLMSMIENKLTTTISLDDARDADLIIEAVPEDMKLKQDIWKKLESVCRPATVFATNTSALPVTDMASVLADPCRLIGLHFFNPAHRMQLLEIICGAKTSDETLATSVAFCRSIGKLPVVVNDGPGFYVTRQLITLLGASIYLIGDGVDPHQIEIAIKDFGMPMGPAELDDLTGIDIGYHVQKTFERVLGDRYKLHPLTEIIYQTGCYGRKTGAGYMDYTGETPVPNKKVVDAIQKYLDDKGIGSRQVSNSKIVDTMLALAINEATLMIEEGICDRPQDMDLAMVYGTGFPPYRGGILRYADSWGLPAVYKKLLELEEMYGERFRPSNLIKEMAGSAKKFYHY